MKRLLAILTLTVAACATVPSASAGPTAGLGQIASVDGLHVRPISIIEDSRCPIDAVCVWAGRVRIHAQVDAIGGSEEYQVQMTLGEAVSVGGGKLTLVGVHPSKLADQPVKRHAYRFTFAFER